MATPSSILAWKIPWMEEPGVLQFTGSQRVGHDRATSLTSLIFPLTKCGLYAVTFFHTVRYRKGEKERGLSGGEI